MNQDDIKKMHAEYFSVRDNEYSEYSSDELKSLLKVAQKKSCRIAI